MAVDGLGCIRRRWSRARRLAGGDGVPRPHRLARLHPARSDDGGRHLMAGNEAHGNGGSPPAIEAGKLTKEYRLGEHRSLQHTLRYLTFGSKLEGPALEVLSQLDLSV